MRVVGPEGQEGVQDLWIPLHPVLKLLAGRRGREEGEEGGREGGRKGKGGKEGERREGEEGGREGGRYTIGTYIF